MKDLFNKTRDVNNVKYSKTRTYKFLGIICVFLFVLVNLSIYMRSDNLKLEFGELSPLNKVWTLTNSGGVDELIDLPYRSDLAKNTVLSVNKSLPDSFKYPRSMRIRSSMQHFIVYLDDKVIFDNEIQDSEKLFYQPVASVWHIIDLPADSNGLILRMDISSDVKMMSGRINEVFFGDRGDLIADLIVKQPHSIAFAFILLIIGFMTGLMSIVINVDKIKISKYLCVFHWNMDDCRNGYYTNFHR